MGRTMLFAVLKMPRNLWGHDNLDEMQRESRYHDAARIIEEQDKEIADLRAQLSDLQVWVAETRARITKKPPVRADGAALYDDAVKLVKHQDALVEAGRKCLDEMCRTVAPRNSYTDAVDAMDKALAGQEGKNNGKGWRRSNGQSRNRLGVGSHLCPAGQDS